MNLAKFGGSSVAAADRIKHIINNIILKNNNLKIVVFSTFGKANKDDIKITDLLEKIAISYFYDNVYAEDLILKIKNKYYNETKKLDLNTDFLDSIFSELETIIKNKPNDFDKYYAAVVGQGERMFVEIPTAYLNKLGTKSIVAYPEKIGMITNSNYRNATLLNSSFENIKKNISELLKKYEKIIIPGFYAIDSNNDFTTFRRGGSDFTGALVSKALNVDLYENYTDVDGILRVDPRLFEEENIKVETIREISYREVRELAYGGANVIHSGTLRPLKDKNIPLRIRNTFNLDNKGTLVVRQKEKTYEVVKGIASRDNFYFLNIIKENMDDEIGIGYAIEKDLFENKISFSQITSSIDSLSYAIPLPTFHSEKEEIKFEEKLNILVNKIKNDENINPDHVRLIKDYSLIYIVGEGMQNTVGLFSKFTKILSDAKINLITVYQVPEQLNVIFGIDKKNSVTAVKELYKNIFLNK